MLTKEKILDILNNQIEKLQTDFSVNKIGIFGSVARDESDQQSDIDILVDFTEPTFDNYMNLKFYLERLFNSEVDLVMEDSVKPRLKPEIEKQVVYP